MSELGANSVVTPWPTGEVLDFTRSELFSRTFEEGMVLVEETAAYLDGSGRQDSKLLSRTAALAYASESMRLTTRLMQVASWLLVQRAVREGEMKAVDACDERYRLGAQEVSRGETPEGVAELPLSLLSLLDRSERLYERILHLDRRMYVARTEQAPPNVLQSHMDRLHAAFGDQG
jgi:regulator of CtrA degradation